MGQQDGIKEAIRAATLQFHWVRENAFPQDLKEIYSFDKDQRCISLQHISVSLIIMLQGINVCKSLRKPGRSSSCKMEYR